MVNEEPEQKYTVYINNANAALVSAILLTMPSLSDIIEVSYILIY